ncbi:transposase [Methanocalculus sp. AMF5]|nr:transposase [Methanocalculus sp. AMF5]
MVIATEGFFMIRDLHNQGYNHSDISRITGFNRRTVRKYLAADEILEKVDRDSGCSHWVAKPKVANLGCKD